MATLEVKKSDLRETKHLSTDADSSTDAIGGWTKNTPKEEEQSQGYNRRTMCSFTNFSSNKNV